LVVMAMTRATSLFFCGLLLTAVGCGANDRQASAVVDCSVADAYEFSPFSKFDGNQTGWFMYADNTPGAQYPDFSKGSNVTMVEDAPARCGDTAMVELRASGHNFYGAGFGDYAHNEGGEPTAAGTVQRFPNNGSRGDGTGYEGISFWARSPGNTDKTFVLYVDDGRTWVHRKATTAPTEEPPEFGQDLDGDGVIGPGDIYRFTRCRIPPPDDLGRPACYYGGALPPSTPTRVPAPDECGNRFHTSITTTENWQLFLLPWSQLVQFPCPNRLEGGIDPADIAQVEIKMVQGTNYDVWLDNVEFYRLRADAGR
jgi:hypothetical protein